MFCIACSSVKGGVGKTATAQALAAGLGKRDRKCLIIDLDQQGSQAISLKLDPDSFERSIYHVLLERSSLQDIIVPTSLPNVDLAPSNLDLAGLEAAERGMGWEQVLKDAVATVADRYEYVILDCPTFLGRSTMNALCAAHLVIVPTQTEFLSYKVLRLLNRIIASVKKKANPTLQVRILRTLYDARIGLSKDVSERVEHLGTTFTTIIPRNVDVGYAALAGQSIFQYSYHSRAASAYRNLIQEVIAYAEATDNSGR